MQINGQLHASAALPSYTLDGPRTGLDEEGGREKLVPVPRMDHPGRFQSRIMKRSDWKRIMLKLSAYHIQNRGWLYPSCETNFAQPCMWLLWAVEACARVCAVNTITLLWSRCSFETQTALKQKCVT
jgi:hypothetical protein